MPCKGRRGGGPLGWDVQKVEMGLEGRTGCRESLLMSEDSMHALERFEWPFDLRPGDEVVLADGRVGVTVRIYCGDLWVIRLANGDEVKATRREVTWAGDTGERPPWATPLA